MSITKGAGLVKKFLLKGAALKDYLVQFFV